MIQRFVLVINEYSSDLMFYSKSHKINLDQKPFLPGIPFYSFYPHRNNIFFLCAAIICLFLNGIAFTSFLMARLRVIINITLQG